MQNKLLTYFLLLFICKFIVIGHFHLVSSIFYRFEKTINCNVTVDIRVNLFGQRKIFFACQNYVCQSTDSTVKIVWKLRLRFISVFSLRRHRNQSFNFISLKDKVKMPKFSCEEEDVIIEFLKKHEILHNVRHKEYRDAEKKNRLWYKLSEELNADGK